MRKLSSALGASATLPKVDARVVVRASAEQYTLDFRAHKDGAASRRRLRVDSCEAVTEASALLLLLMLDPILADQLGAAAIMPDSDDIDQGPQEVGATGIDEAPEQKNPTSGSSELPPKAEPTAAQEGAQTAIPAGESRTREVSLVNSERWVDGGWLGVGPTMMTAMTPNPAWGVAGQAGFTLGRVRVAAAVSYLAAADAAIAGVEGARLRSSMARAGLRVEPEFVAGRWRFGPAVGVSVEYVAARSINITRSEGGATQWLSVQGGAWSTWTIAEGWGLSAQVGASLPLERPRYNIDGISEPVHRPSALGLETFLGAYWAWGSRL